MLGLTLDPTSRHALGRQLAEALRGRIRSGELRGGERIPSSRALALALGVSRTVVVEALEQLQAEGFLEGRRGSGHYVCAGSGVPKPRRLAPAPPQSPVKATRPGGIAFHTGLPALDLIPWAAWGQALKREAPRLSRGGYGDAEGLTELREALADHLYRTRGLRAGPEAIFITSGTTQALSILTAMACGRRRSALLEDPCHQGLRHQLEAMGVPIRPVPVDGQGLKVDALTTPQAGLVYVTPSHQFPLGGVLPAPRRAQLVAWARSHGVLVLEDDYDGEFRYDGPPLPPLRESDPETVATLGTFSKSFAPALRLGYVVLPEGLREGWTARKRFTDVHTPLIEQAAMAQFIRSGRLERHLHRMRKVYAERRLALLDALASSFQDRARVEGASAGLHMAVRFPGMAFTVPLMARLHAAGVDLTPLSAHAIQNPRACRDTLLLGYGNLQPRDIQEGVRRMKQVLG